MFTRCGLLLVATLLALCVSAQNLNMGNTISQSSSNYDAAPIKPGSAWILSYPLGLHIPSTLDTTTYNYQKRWIPSMLSDAYATTGNLGAEGINMIYFQRPAGATFFFDNALHPWIHTRANQKNYNVYIPTTIVAYNFAGSRINRTDRLQADFAGNVNRRIGVGAFVDYLYSKGCYEAQATKDFSFGANVYYLGDRYEMQTEYTHFNLLNKENGGITNDLYITDPAELQGGIDKIEAKSIPTRLSAAHSRLNGDELFSTHTFKVGFWKEEQVNDTLTRDVYVPVMRFIYSFDYLSRHHFFINTNSSQAHDFWQNFYLNSQATDENTKMHTITNSLGFEMIEGFNKWVKFGLSAYAQLLNRRYRQTNYPGFSVISDNDNADLPDLTPLPENFAVDPQTDQTMMFVGGDINKRKGSILKYSAGAKFGVLGSISGDIDLHGDINTNIPLFGDTVTVKANASYALATQPFLLHKYISNHFAWCRKLEKTNTLRFGGSLHIPWTQTSLSANFENVQNYTYFDYNAIPDQYSGNIQVFAAAIEQNLKFGIWHWNNRLTYQVSSNKEILPLPAFALYSNMYLGFTAFKVLQCQIGVDCDYYTSYTALQYQPATMSFHLQNPEQAVKVGNFPLANLYATARLYKVRFYVLWSHFNQGWFTKNYFSLPHYPINPSRLQFGLSVDFPN